jgi:hypothetical protein
MVYSKVLTINSSSSKEQPTVSGILRILDYEVWFVGTLRFDLA